MGGYSKVAQTAILGRFQRTIRQNSQKRPTLGVNLNVPKHRKIISDAKIWLEKTPNKRNFFKFLKISNLANFGHFGKVIQRQNDQKLAILG